MPPTRAYTDAMFRHLLDSATELADARRGVLDAAAGCLRSAERLPPGQVAIFGAAVGDAIGALATAHATGDAHGIETAARILSGLVHLSPAQVLAAGADTTGAAFFAALELLRYHLSELNRALEAAATDRFINHNTREVAPGLHIQALHMGELAINLNVPERPPPPRQLPDRTPVTRPAVRDAITAIDKLTTETPAGGIVIVAVIGAPGAGATTAALDAAHRAAAPAGAFYLDWRHETGNADPRSALGSWLTDLGIPADQQPNGTDARAAWWRSLTQKGVTVLIDGATHPAHVRPLIPAGPSTFIVTTRTSQLAALVLNGARIIAIGDGPHDGPD